MTTVYIPRPIRTVEDAEALPVGTVAIDPEHTDLAAATTYGPGRAFIRAAHWEASDLPWHNDDDGAQWHDVVVGMIALVPVEAEEEWEAEQETAAKAATKHRRTYGLLRDEDQR